MGITGKIFAYKNDQRVESMEVGTIRYIDVFDIILTRKALFLDRVTPVVPHEEIDGDDFDSYVSIKRIGIGFTEDDFELDFSHISKDDTSIVILPESVYIELLEEASLHVVFKNPEIEFLSDPMDGLLPDDIIDHLNQKLEEAIEIQDFDQAAKLKKQIEKEENKRLR